MQTFSPTHTHICAPLCWLSVNMCSSGQCGGCWKGWFSRFVGPWRPQSGYGLHATASQLLPLTDGNTLYYRIRTVWSLQHTYLYSDYVQINIYSTQQCDVNDCIVYLCVWVYNDSKWVISLTFAQSSVYYITSAQPLCSGSQALIFTSYLDTQGKTQPFT